MFRPIMRSVQADCLSNGIAIGWAPNLPGGLRTLWSHIRNKDLCTDKSSFDWTVQPWMMEFVAELFSSLVDPANSTVVYNHCCSMLGAKTFTAPGVSFHHPHDGVLPSGWKLTILVNSILQLSFHELAGGIGSIIAMGDDTIQDRVDNTPAYMEALSRLGPLIKVATIGHEFCGMEFTAEKYLPVYLEKHSYALRHLKASVAVETLASYQYLYAYDNARLAAIQDWMRQLGSPDLVKPRLQLQFEPRGWSIPISY
ncbi:hypothetical protein 2 [Beihai sobemo-like virus 16]|uniref:hypothetical protein 2 n=1 Tax=Beihai sobemo-like virus 16 TaxID=1922687 RepID=UPI000909C787|nr:hypothetical protein 2 [Beihai sobemo-like virus 16]APG75666.1 hypothetical protein 2 [Beihai sobemo-like virus 16]